MQNEFVSVGLINPKSPSNVGSVMRAAGCYQVNQVVYSGNRYDRAKKMSTDTKKATSSIPLINVDSLGVDDLIDAVDGDTKIVCVDLIQGATPLPAFKHPDKALYIFGPEDGTIGQKVVDRADFVVFVPTVGCMNLAASVNVLLYDRLAKSVQSFAGDELIRQSKDVNNNVKVRSNIQK
ncbi:TrmH family RNA methyltransferase [Marinomonas rhizomae]|uniref:tRNA(Leu) C34 or U34 (Ribose-2'-O)-methylase TrmL n=1 Tax=Marinomonas rhizomae TaxID=491948 RepID=A0A366JGW0_9GAMM|nr:RNA methyltransferase [Marinomonas rhizomae]RBP85720.1 tRNA(Leu) C34 or U34 (ribose-2'-O)-methylase TrmL [Marinomonas rhizomae]RNF75656.1 TrmH family RNA methyltransferase [Marinomonas rhizomae]